VLAALEEAQRLLARAWLDLDDARFTLEADRALAAANRAYYAAFHAAQAALLLEGLAPTSHKGTLLQFSQHYVRTGRIPEHVASILAVAATARDRADYDALSHAELRGVADLVRDVEAFVTAVAALFPST
jgi:uncharacterized protein